MTSTAAVRLMAGVMLTLSLALAHVVSPWFLLMTGFVGANLAQYALTGFCPATRVFERLGLGASCSTAGMTVGRGLSLGAGLVVLVGVGLGALQGSLLLTTVVAGAVAASMTQSAITGWCPMMTVARWTGLPEG